MITVETILKSVMRNGAYMTIHQGNDFRLSASDQSVIDMMKHYLHTSRKTECSGGKLSNVETILKSVMRNGAYMTIHQVCNNSNTTGVSSGTGPLSFRST
jgi:hypothetical protein